MMHPKNPSMRIEHVLWDKSGKTACTHMPSTCTVHDLIPKPSHLQYHLQLPFFFLLQAIKHWRWNGLGTRLQMVNLIFLSKAMADITHP